MLTGRLHACILQVSRPTASMPYTNTCAMQAISLPKRNAEPVSLLQTLQLQRRLTSTSPNLPNKNTPNSSTLLAQQRLRRPLSPHLSIYRPQITSTLSVLMRITGLGMSGTFCLYPLLYLSSPFLGIDVSVASLVATVGSWPTFIKLPLKMAVAWTFTFHGLNSLRFLTWDVARGITNKRIKQSGWAVVGVSFVGALTLVGLV